MEMADAANFYAACSEIVSSGKPLVDTRFPEGPAIISLQTASLFLEDFSVWQTHFAKHSLGAEETKFDFFYDMTGLHDLQVMRLAELVEKFDSCLQGSNLAVSCQAVSVKPDVDVFAVRPDDGI